MTDTADADLLALLREQVEALGIRVDGRWGVDRLRAEMDAAETAQLEAWGAAESGEHHPPTVDPEQPEQPETIETPGAVRAGGHIDRGDGRGWVIEQGEE